METARFAKHTSMLMIQEGSVSKKLAQFPNSFRQMVDVKSVLPTPTRIIPAFTLALQTLTLVALLKSLTLMDTARIAIMLTEITLMIPNAR